MNQDINFLLSTCIKLPPSDEEIEIFNAYKKHINRDFELFKKINLALTEQEDELKSAKELLYKKVIDFENKTQNANDVLNIINKEIDIARSVLSDLKRECNQYRQQIRHLEKKVVSLKACLPPEEKN